MVLVRMWRESDHPRACAVVHHICTMILATPQASSQLKSVQMLAHIVLWPTVADAMHDADELDPDELTSHPKHLILNEFASSEWQSLPFCTDGNNVLANLDAACGILGSIGLDVLSNLEIIPVNIAEEVVRQMADIKAGGCISHFLLWCRLSAAIAIGDVKLMLLEANASQDKAAILVAPSLKHVETCFSKAMDCIKRGAAAADLQPLLLLFLDFIEVDSRLEVSLWCA
jgi:hypothetical protein